MRIAAEFTGPGHDATDGAAMDQVRVIVEYPIDVF